MNLANTLYESRKNKYLIFFHKAKIYRDKKLAHDHFIQMAWEARKESRYWNDKHMELPTREELYKFIEYHYLSAKFKPTDGYTKGREDRIVDSYMMELSKHGFAWITCHESITGQNIKFYADLSIATEKRMERRKPEARLTHIF